MIQTLTDSISDIPNEIMEKLGIEVIPMTLPISSKVYWNVMDIDLETLFGHAAETGAYPRTSALLPEDNNSDYFAVKHPILISVFPAQNPLASLMRWHNEYICEQPIIFLLEVSLR